MSGTKVRLKQIVEGKDTKLGRTFDHAIGILIVLSLISFAIETLPNLSAGLRHFLWGFEVFTVAVFTLEYLLRIIVADNKLGYIFSFFGLIDLLAILPFYVARGMDLRAVRVVRLLRIFRMLKLVRYTDALQRWHVALRKAKEELVLFFALAGVLIFLAATGIYYFENEAQPEAFASVFHALWWATVTFTTVGYGDVYPITVGGRVFTFVMLILGLGVVAIPPAILASALTQTREEEAEGEESRG